MPLISPGVQTSITDESLFVPNTSSLVPLFFIATQDEKRLSNGEPAVGTYENSVVRSITSTRQSINFYGEPRFLTDGQGTQLHGDARNEYGLLALNQYLGIGNAAFVVRANVNLNDSLDDIQNQWDAKSEDVSVVIQNTVQNYINNVNLANGITTDGASVLANLSNRIPASQNQTQAEFDGIAPFGSATVGQSATGAVNFAFGDVITFTNGMQIRIGLVDQHIGATSGTGEPTQFTVIAAGAQTTVDAATGNDIQWLGTPLVIESIVDSAGNDAAANSPTLHPNNTLTPRDGFSLTPQLANFDVFIQTHVDFPTFTGGMNYAVDDLVTMNNSAQVRVAAVDANGSITDFALVTQGNPVTVGTVNAIAANPANPTTPQTGFTFEVTADNLETRRTTVTNEELKTIVRDATSLIFDQEIGVFSFRTLEDDFFDIKSDSDTTLPSTFQVFPNGFDFAAGSDQFIGFDGEVENLDLGFNTYRIEVLQNTSKFYANGTFIVEYQHNNPYYNDRYFGVFASTDEYNNSTWRFDYFQVLPLNE